MKIKILGSAAGGGFPQWNCACHNCAGLRAGTFRARPRSQTQIAFSPDDRVWFLIGASPDLRAQILSARELSPQPDKPGHTPIGGVFLPSADVDAVMGLLHLREFQSFFVFASAGVQRALRAENRIFKVLERADPPVHWQVLSSDGTSRLPSFGKSRRVSHVCLQHDSAWRRLPRLRERGIPPRRFAR